LKDRPKVIREDFKQLKLVRAGSESTHNDAGFKNFLLIVTFTSVLFLAILILPWLAPVLVRVGLGKRSLTDDRHLDNLLRPCSHQIPGLRNLT